MVDQITPLPCRQILPGPETMDGVYYDANLKRVYMTGGRWYGTPEASPGWLYVYQQKDADHYEIISKIKTRPGSGTSLLVQTSTASMLLRRRSAIRKQPSSCSNLCPESSLSWGRPKSLAGQHAANR